MTGLYNQTLINVSWWPKHSLLEGFPYGPKNEKDLSGYAALHDTLMRGVVYHVHAKRISDAYTKGSSARVTSH